MINTFKLSAQAKKSAIAAIKGYMVGEPPLAAKWSHDAANTDSDFYDSLENAATELVEMGVTPETLDEWVERQEQQTAYEVIASYLSGKEPDDIPQDEDVEPFLKYQGIKKVARVARNSNTFNAANFNIDQVGNFLAIASKYQF